MSLRPGRVIVPIAVGMASMVLGCADDAADGGNRRLGEEGRVRFVGGGGCSDSTTVALGSTAHLTLEPERGSLPVDLRVESRDQSIIDARSGLTLDEVLLTGAAVGSTKVELRSQGRRFDRLGFDVALAHSATFSAATATLAGASYHVELDELYGACGEDCPLIGGDLLDWTITPSRAMTVVAEDDRLTHFRAETPGTVVLLGEARVGRADLVEQTVTLVPLQDVTTVEARIIVQTPDEEVHDPAPLPATLVVGSQFMITVSARAGRIAAPIDGADLEWTVPTNQDSVSRTTPGPDPVDGPIFSAAKRGRASLTVHVPLLDRTESYDLVVE